MLREGALAGLKVLELTDRVSGQVAGSFCARLLGDAGADVVKVESPQGDHYRKSGQIIYGHGCSSVALLVSHCQMVDDGVFIEVDGS